MKGKWLEYNGFNKNVLNTTQLPLNEFGWNPIKLPFLMINDEK